MENILVRLKMDKQKFRQTCTSNIRVPIYCTLVLVCSIISLPEEYKIDKRNIFNQWFVKLGWFWTCSLMLPLTFSSIKVDDRENIALAIFRIILSTILWFVSINFFQLIDDTTGFDISGHTFLLTFSNLLLTSELKHSEQSCAVNEFKPTGAITPQSLKLPLIILRSLWDFMLLQTTLYYHTMLQKTIALVWAISSWYLVHTLFYEEIEAKSKSKTRGRERSVNEH